LPYTRLKIKVILRNSAFGWKYCANGGLKFRFENGIITVAFDE
jgi:hypothetical protein